MVSFGLGLATLNRTGDLLDVYYPTPLLDPDPGLVALWRQAYPALETSDWVLIDAKGGEAEPSLRAELNPFHQPPQSYFSDILNTCQAFSKML